MNAILFKTGAREMLERFDEAVAHVSEDDTCNKKVLTRLLGTQAHFPRNILWKHLKNTHAARANAFGHTWIDGIYLKKKMGKVTFKKNIRKMKEALKLDVLAFSVFVDTAEKEITDQITEMFQGPIRGQELKDRLEGAHTKILAEISSLQKKAAEIGWMKKEGVQNLEEILLFKAS